MTMRQVVGLLTVIGKADITDFYNNTLSYATVHGTKLPSLDEFLRLSLNEGGSSNSFDENTDKFLEEQALKSLNERRSKNV